MDGLVMKYFVLKPAGADPYADASRAGMLAYAKAIKVENPEMAKELEAWVDREATEVLRTVR